MFTPEFSRLTYVEDEYEGDEIYYFTGILNTQLNRNIFYEKAQGNLIGIYYVGKLHATDFLLMRHMFIQKNCKLFGTDFIK